MKNKPWPGMRIAGIIIREGRLLLLKGRGYNRFWTPGGKCKKDETEEECLNREIKEETGMNLISTEFFGECDGFYFYQPGRELKQRVYLVKTEGEPKPGAEIEDFIWLSKEDFLNKRFPMLPNESTKIIPDLIKRKIW